MAYKCRICGANDVDQPCGVCELCAIAQDPYTQELTGVQPQRAVQIPPASSRPAGPGDAPRRSTNRRVLLNGGAPLTNADPYGNDMTAPPQSPSVPVHRAGQAVQQQNIVSSAQPAQNTSSAAPAPSGALATGIIKNVTVDNHKKSLLAKWFRALFGGIPFTLDDDVTMFQIFPDYSGTSLNVLGNACDQVIVYGQLNQGTICENNEVEVFGRRDSHNNIIAKSIHNRASGTIVTAQRTLNPGAVWVLTLLALGLVCSVVMALGIEGIIWAVVILLCLTNFPLVLKIAGAVIGAVFSLLRRLFH